MSHTRKCILVMDSARGRLFSFLRGADGRSALVESDDVVTPARRRRDCEVFTEPRPGLRQAQAGGPRHAVDDHRNRHREEEERGFAVIAMAHAAALCEKIRADEIVVVASAPMLGVLRHALSHAPPPLRARVSAAIAGEVTRLTPSKLHDWLAIAGLLPPRTRFGTELSS